MTYLEIKEMVADFAKKHNRRVDEIDFISLIVKIFNKDENLTLDKVIESVYSATRSLETDKTIVRCSPKFSIMFDLHSLKGIFGIIHCNKVRVNESQYAQVIALLDYNIGYCYTTLEPNNIGQSGGKLYLLPDVDADMSDGLWKALEFTTEDEVRTYALRHLDELEDIFERYEIY